MGALDGKVALVTGGGSGIGRATCERFAAEGASVCVVDVDEASGAAVAGAVGGVFVAGDMGDARDVDTAFRRCVDEVGALDVAFLNAGIAIGVADLTELPDDLYRRIVRVNLDGVVYGVRAAVRAMRDRGGAIVATSSLAGLIAFPPDPVYDATKHAVVGLVRSVAPTLAPLGITANTVNPGIVDTNIMSAEARELLTASGYPLIPPARIADAVLRLVTSGVTGECWVCQPGRDPVAYEFHGVPGPAGDEPVRAGDLPAGLTDWSTTAREG